jgi:hypothetical protein
MDGAAAATVGIAGVGYYRPPHVMTVEEIKAAGSGLPDVVFEKVLVTLCVRLCATHPRR